MDFSHEAEQRSWPTPSEPTGDKPFDCLVSLCPQGGEGMLCVRAVRMLHGELVSINHNDIMVTVRRNGRMEAAGLGYSMDFTLPEGAYTLEAVSKSGYWHVPVETCEVALAAGKFTVAHVMVFEAFEMKFESAEKWIGRPILRTDFAIAGFKEEASCAAQVGILTTLAEAGAPVVPVLNRKLMVERADKPGMIYVAYQMKWIEGVHSKVNKPDFNRELFNLGEAERERALDDLKKLDEYHRGTHSIRDLQLMLETSTGHLYVVDPAGLGPASESIWIAKWRNIALREEEPKIVESYDKRD